MRAPLAALALALASPWTPPALAEVQTYRIDNTHSFANWEIRHVVARVSGTFHDVQGKVVLDTDNIAKSTIEAQISVYSLNSSHLKRDVHLLTEDYLDARDHPDMKFVSTRVVPATPEKGSVTGNLTLGGVTRPITLDYQILGVGKDPWGGMRSGFRATTRIKRADFGINKGLPYGPVGNEVDITLLIEGIRLDASGQPWIAVKAQELAPKVMSFPLPVDAAPQPVPIPAGPLPAATHSPTPVQEAAAPTQPAATPATPASELKEKVKQELMQDMLEELAR